MLLLYETILTYNKYVIINVISLRYYGRNLLYPKYKSKSHPGAIYYNFYTITFHRSHNLQSPE